jgi:hypothetical protein
MVTFDDSCCGPLGRGCRPRGTRWAASELSGLPPGRESTPSFYAQGLMSLLGERRAVRIPGIRNICVSLNNFRIGATAR